MKFRSRKLSIRYLSLIQTSYVIICVFQEHLQTLIVDVGPDVDIGAFIEEHEKLQLALRKSNQSVTRLYAKCENLVKSIRQREKQYLYLCTAHEKNEAKKAELQGELELNRAAKDEMLEKTEEKKAKVAEAMAKIKELDQLLLVDSNEAIEAQQLEMARLRAELDKLSGQVELKRSAVAKERAQNIELTNQLQTAHEKRREGQLEMDYMQQKITDTVALVKKEKRRKEQTDSQLKVMHDLINQRNDLVTDRRERIIQAKKELNDEEFKTMEQKQVLNENETQHGLLQDEVHKMTEELAHLVAEAKAAHKLYTNAQKEVDEERKRMNDAKGLGDEKISESEMWKRKAAQMEEDKAAAEKLKSDKVLERNELKRRLQHLQIKLNNFTKQIDTCVREREVLGQNHLSKLDGIKKQELQLKIKRSTLKNIRNEHQGFLVSIRNLRKTIDKLGQDTATHQADLARRKLQKARAMEEVLEREEKIAQYNAQIVENEAKLRQQQNLLDNVTTERNQYRKLIIEQKNDLAENTRYYDNLLTQIQQLKAEIADKDIGFVTEHFNLEEVMADIHGLKGKNKTSDSKLDSVDKLLKKQAGEVRKLSMIIADADEELCVQTKQYNTVVNEQRVLNQQLIKRNDELAVLYEELKLQNSLLRKGQEQYREKQKEMRLLLETEKELQQQLDDVQADVEKYEELKTTIGVLHRQLVEEKLKVKALTDELAKPINIHRWRRLKDTNADSHGTLKRVRNLQKSIIRKAGEVEAKDNLIQEKEKLYVDLRRVLARQPGAEAAEQLRLYMKTLKQKKAAFKTLQAELKMYQAKVYEYKYDVQRLQNELQMLNLQYFEQQRKALNASSGGPSVGSSRPTSSFHSGSGNLGDTAASHNLVAAPPADYLPPTDPFGSTGGLAASTSASLPPMNPFGEPPADPFGVTAS